MYPLLLKFLLEKDALDIFIENKANGEQTRSGSHLGNDLLIDFAFRWSDTEQGFKYWQDLQREYSSCYYKHNKII